jgi:hypothetical protein
MVSTFGHITLGNAMQGLGAGFFSRRGVLNQFHLSATFARIHADFIWVCLSRRIFISKYLNQTPGISNISCFGVSVYLLIVSCGWSIGFQTLNHEIFV